MVEWKTMNFSNFETILHVAGIAHVSADPKMEDLYYSVNRDLPIAVAKKAKQEGVKQFIFMSSIIVYGSDSHITADTKPNPTNYYGKSKLQAEEALLALADDTFAVAVIRTPMVYGQNCKGNFPALMRLAKKTFIFPDIDNQRSMIYIDNLCAFIALCIKNRTSGVVYPQNKEYVRTTDIIQQAARHLGRKIHFTKLFNFFIRLLAGRIELVDKVFGDKTYDKNLSSDLFSYNLYTFEESIKRYLELTKK
jgi:UDP-glucose 4-epimerase